ncbi:hypothetical protein KSC_073730 [Ktedonobacter sp. SOSP1-52]|nr:hypothetical protein KSC_073730 [Ktedonobacter sp. SOSP1-52]
MALQHKLHRQTVGLLITLRAQGLNRWPLTGIQQAHLDKGAVGIAPDLAAKGINLLDQVSLGRSTHRRVTGHQGHAIQIHREQ